MTATTLKDEERQPCEIWTRVMGYFRPVSAFNIGKKSEYAERKCFSEKKSDGGSGMFKFGRKSEKCLKELDPRLKDLARLMMSKQEMDFAIICGHRNEPEQNAAFAAGASKVKFPDSKHNTLPARAYDRVPYPIPLNAAGEWDDKSPLWGRLAALERQCAEELNVKITQGCAWTFKDLPHCELVEE